MKGFLYGKTEYSIGNSILALDDYINYAKELKYEFLTITDNNLYGAYKFYTKCIKNNIKPIIGLEYEFLDNLSKSKVIIYAKNNEGYKALVKISGKIEIEKIDTLDILTEYYKDLYIIYPFNDSYLERAFVSHDLKEVELELSILKKYDIYIGISKTNKISKFNLTNEFIEYLSLNDYKYVDIHEARYQNQNDSIVLKALLKMNDSKEIIEEFDDFSMPQNPYESDTINEIVNNINLNLYNEKINLPSFPNKKGYKSNEYLRALCYKGLEKRGVLKAHYKDRLDYELNVINKMGYDDYFLIVWDFIRYAKQNDILVGPGRGSAAGSLVSYTLGITDIDPIKYGLYFERFLNPERVSMPDIDVDFPDDKRDEVIEYVKNLYGDNHISLITTFVRYKLKSSLNDLARITDISKDRLSIIKDIVENDKSDNPYDDLINKYRDSDPKLCEFLYIAKRLENLPKTTSTHPAGVILSSVDLGSFIPLTNGLSGLYQSQFEKDDLEEIGLLKMDFLAISNLNIIKNTIDQIDGLSISSIRNINLNDQKVYRMLSSGDTLGIFQLESRGMTRFISKLKPTEFNDLVAALALFRPGPMDNLDEFVERKHGKKFTYIHPDLESILNYTYGIILYQEQIMQIAQKFAGFSLGEADLLRRAISKKKASGLNELEDDFIKRAKARGYNEGVAKEIYDLILKFANYGFNKSHSVAYAYFAYQMAYLKVNYFSLFMGNVFNTAIGDEKKLVSYFNYCKSHRIKVHKPNIFISRDKFVTNKEGIFIPFSSIKGIGTQVASKIVEERDRNGIYNSFYEFKERCSFLNKNQFEALVFSGALDYLGKTKKDMINETNEVDQIFLKTINKSELVIKSEEYEFEYLAEMEKKYLGFNITYSPFARFSNIRIKNNVSNISDLKVNQIADVLVIVKSIETYITKSKEKMQSGIIEDEFSDIKFVIFPKTLNTIPKIEKNKVYLLKGSLKEDKNKEYQNSFNIISATKLN